MPITVTGTANDPVYFSQDTDDNCAATLIVLVTAFAAAVAWYDERNKAINYQHRIENEILDMLEWDVNQFLTHDFPAQKRAIQAALDVPDCEVHCSECIVEIEINTEDTRCEGGLLAIQKQAYMRAKGMDKLLAQERYAACMANRNNILIAGLNLAFADYSNYYQFLANASTIQSSLAGMAGAAYAQAVAEFSYALTLLGRGQHNPRNGLI